MGGIHSEKITFIFPVLRDPEGKVIDVEQSFEASIVCSDDQTHSSKVEEAQEIDDDE